MLQVYNETCRCRGASEAHPVRRHLQLPPFGQLGGCKKKKQEPTGNLLRRDRERTKTNVTSNYKIFIDFKLHIERFNLTSNLSLVLTKKCVVISMLASRRS